MKSSIILGILITMITLSLAADNDGCSIAFFTDGEADVFKKGAVVFTNRNYTALECPERLAGKNFLRAPIDGVVIRITEPGTLTVLTPYEGAKTASQTKALEANGFVKTDGEPFQLFGGDDWNRVTAHTKTVAKGQGYRFGKWVVVVGFEKADKIEKTPWSENTGELLYNGIRLPQYWPPSDIDTADESPMPVPYLDFPPKVIPIDVGRQLFVDDFLIEQTTLDRVFHKPVKYEGNPVLKPETELEINAVRTVPYEKGEPGNAVASPKSGGVWWCPKEQIFKMWYEAGWIGTIAYAVSADGINWQRPKLDIVPGTNQVLPTDLTADSWTVVPNWNSTDPQAMWTLFMQPPGKTQPGWALTSPDGIHWNRRTPTGNAGDRSTHFYNPFREKWIYSIRAGFPGRGRARHYYECDDFMAGANWTDGDRAVWLMADRDDPTDAQTREKPQMYNLDAVAYESIMLGFFEIHHGPKNDDCMVAGLPKITELMFAYSRDGFHWHRPDRRAHIAAERKDVWDRGYVQSIGNICVVRGDKLWFYYSGFQGDTSKTGGTWMQNGMYDRGATGVAMLRRDGFVSMDAKDKGGSVTTRPVTFSGSHLFVNADVPRGALRVEVRDGDGKPIAPFTLDNCIPFTGDSTLQQMQWKGVKDMSAIAGKPVHLHFELTAGSLYAFWVSRDATGRSDGYVAGGGPGYTGATDTAGIEALKAERGIKINYNR